VTPQVGVRAGQLTVEQAVVDTLTLWMPTYVVAAARRYAAAELFGYTSASMESMLAAYEFPFRPRGISVASTFEDWDTTALPQIKVLSPSWQKAGGDQTGDHIKYGIQVACIVGAQQRDDTRMIRATYEDAILNLRQHQRLGGVAAGVDLVGGGAAQLSEVDGKDAETFQGSIAVFEVLLTGVLDPRNGPTEVLEDVDGVPPVNPGDPLLDTPDVTLEPEAINGDG
jgi:hypothetical protein